MADVTQRKYGEANRVYSGSTTRNTTTATGTQAITGVGFKPQAIVFFVCQNDAAGEASWGVDDGASHHLIFDYHNTTANAYYHDDVLSIRCWQGSSDYYDGKLDSFDSDGFTVHWTKTGSPTGTITIAYIAYA